MYFRQLRSFLISAGIVSFFIASSFASSGLRDDEFTRKAEKGYMEMYRLNFNAAAEIFTALRRQYPGHPAPPLYMATVVWLQQLNERQELSIEYFLHPTYFVRKKTPEIPAATRQLFLDLIHQSQENAQLILKDQAAAGDAQYFLGVGECLSSAFTATMDHDPYKSLKQSKRAYKILSRLLEFDPDYFDAYMMLGLYDYITGNMPWYYKWVAMIAGYRGSKTRAFQYLDSAAENARYASDEAHLLRMMVLMREKQFHQALDDISILAGRHPYSSIIHLTKASILKDMGDSEAAADTYSRVLQFPDIASSAASRWEIGNSLLAIGKPQAALDCYSSLISDPTIQERWHILSLLQSGCALDALGQRQEAIRQYKKVLSMKDHDNAHAHAREFIKTAYTGGPGNISLPRLLSK